MYLFTDIDDTLTHQNGLLPKEAFTGLWELDEAGIKVIPVTGRPAGWCELIARQWPVHSVIGENGGFYFRYERQQRQMKRHFALDTKSRKGNKLKLLEIEQEILREVPKAAVASDQFSRLMDLAIDICEDIPPLPDKEIHKIIEIFHRHGAQAKLSSIHVNGWFGDYNKLSMCQILCDKEFHLHFSEALHKMAYVGDSPNDEPMFKAFTHSFGVANIQNFTHKMKALPGYVTQSDGGMGFIEVVRRLCKLI